MGARRALRSDVASRLRATAGRRRRGSRDRLRPARRACAASGSGSRAGAQPLERSRLGELQAAEAGHEVAAAHAAGLLERLQDRVDRGEAARHALEGHRVARQHAVAREQLLGERLGALGRARRPPRRGTTAPAPDRGGRHLPARAERPTARPRRSARAACAATNARSAPGVSFVTSPAHARSHSASTTGRARPPPAASSSSPKKRRAVLRQVLADRARGARPAAARHAPAAAAAGRR